MASVWSVPSLLRRLFAFVCSIFLVFSFANSLIRTANPSDRSHLQALPLIWHAELGFKPPTRANGAEHWKKLRRLTLKNEPTLADHRLGVSQAIEAIFI